MKISVKHNMSKYNMIWLVLQYTCSAVARGNLQTILGILDVAIYNWPQDNSCFSEWSHIFEGFNFFFSILVGDAIDNDDTSLSSSAEDDNETIIKETMHARCSMLMMMQLPWMMLKMPSRHIHTMKTRYQRETSNTHSSSSGYLTRFGQWTPGKNVVYTSPLWSQRLT